MLALQSRLFLGDKFEKFEFIKPGRELLKEGELLKISRKGVDPRYFILLTDCLLYTQYSTTTTNLKLSYEIRLEHLQLQVPKADDFQTEFSFTSPGRSATLRAT